LATAVSYIEFLMGHKTQWCGVVCCERGTRQEPVFRCVHLTIVEVENKQMLPILSVHILVLFIRQALRMRRIIL
jgi:hypothetical protein